MIRKILYILIILTSMGCRVEQPLVANAGIDECAVFKKMATHCLRDWLIDEDDGGYWEQIGSTPQDISDLLIGNNPCVDWEPLSCGKYELRYIVGDACCRDTAVIRPTKCCLIGTSICN